MESGSREAFIHEVDYEIIDSAPVLRIFGREAGGGSLVALARDFKPYFYCLPEPGSDPKQLMRRILTPDVSEPASVIGASVERRKWLGEDRSVVKVTVDSPRNIRTSRSLLSRIPAVSETLEKDILFKRRYIIDMGLNPLGLTRMTGNTVPTQWPADDVIELSSPAIPGADWTELSGLRVLAFDIEVSSPSVPSPQLDPVIMIGVADRDESSVLTYGRRGDGLETCRDEGEMISRFISRVRDGDYDVLIGYNSDSFDLPYLRTRARRNGLRLRLGRDLSEVGYQPAGITRRSIVKGRINIDLYPPVRRMVNLPTYTLAEVYRHLLGREKALELTGEEVHRLWEEGTNEGAERIGMYCASDVEATMRVAEEILPTLMELSKHTKQLLADVARMGQSQLVEWLLIREAFARGELAPNKPNSAELSRRQRQTYEGGYVLEPRRGLQSNIVSLDFRSLYPTIIVTHNVDISTLDCDCCQGKNVSPTGHGFCTEAEGFIPSILKRLIERRSQIKEEMAGLDPMDPETKRMDAMQNALKILSNSFYGYSGYPQARWYSRACAESVAAWGREYIMSTMRSAEAEGFQVLYSDTDSIFITRQDVGPEELVSGAKSFLERVNASLPGMIQLEYQSYSPRGFFVSKKRYALLDESGTISTRGLEVVRRDWSPISKETQRRVLRAILEDGDPGRAADEVREAIRKVSERRVSLQDLVISTRMTKSLDSYDADAPHVALAKRMMERGEEFRQGASIDYIVRKGSGRVGDRAQLARDATIQDYDVDYYVGSQVLPPSMRILSTLGYREEDLRYYRTKQRTLDTF